MNNKMVLITTSLFIEITNTLKIMKKNNRK